MNDRDLITSFYHGLTRAKAEQVAQLYFGAFFLRISKNDQDECYEIYVMTQISGDDGETIHIDDAIDIEHWKQHWTRGSKIIRQSITAIEI